MNSHKAYEDVQLIKEMLSKSKKNICNGGKYFILWGYAVLAGITASYLLVHLGFHRFIWLSWFAVMLVGTVVTALFAAGEKRHSRVVTMLDRIMGGLGAGFFFSFLLASLVFPLLNVYPVTAIGPVTGMLAGTFIFILAVIYQWKLLFIPASVWFIFAVGVTFIPDELTGLAMSFPLVFGYIVPGHMLLYKERKGQRDE